MAMVKASADVEKDLAALELEVRDWGDGGLAATTARRHHKNILTSQI
jgi:hypothetical protein